MTKADVAQAVAGMAQVMAVDPTSHRHLTPAFLILTESLVELHAQPRTRKQEMVECLAEIELAMPDCKAADRRRAVMADLNIARSYYFELRTAAVEQGLLES